MIHVFWNGAAVWTKAQDNWKWGRYRRLSYLTPPIRHQNKWFRVCSQRHTDTCRHLRGLRSWLSGLRSLSGFCPVNQTNSNEKNFKIAVHSTQTTKRFKHYIINTTLSYTFNRSSPAEVWPKDLCTANPVFLRLHHYSVCCLNFYLGCQ